MLSYTHAHEKKIIKLLAINEEFFLGLLSYIHANEKIIIKLLVDNEFYVIYLPSLLFTLYATTQRVCVIYLLPYFNYRYLALIAALIPPARS